MLKSLNATPLSSSTKKASEIAENNSQKSCFRFFGGRDLLAGK
jgi:hypothetical protein